MKKGKIIILSGPSGSGKTTLHKKLLANQKAKNGIVKTVSFTTRPRRPGERHGWDYFFVSRKMFQYKKKRRHFLETEQVFDHFYGTSRKSVDALLRKGKNVLLCIDVKGAKTVRKKFPEAISVFIKPPSLKVLQKRLKGRGSENEKSIRVRLQTAREELKEASAYRHTIINDNLKTAYKQLEKIIASELG